MTSSTYIGKNHHHLKYTILIPLIFLVVYLTALIRIGETSPVNQKVDSQKPTMNSDQSNDLSRVMTSLNGLKTRFNKIEKKQQWLIQELTKTLQQKIPQQISKFADTDYASPNTMDESEQIQQNDIDIHETTFQQEEIDEHWSGKMHDQIHTLLDELDVFDTTLDKLDCRATTCRIEFVHPEGNGQETFIESMMANKAFSGELQMHNILNAQGEEITLVYLAKSNQSLIATE